MKRHALLTMGLIALLVVGAGAQPDAEDLRALFPSSDSLREFLGDENWLLSNLTGLTGAVPDALAASAIYENPQGKLQITIFDFVLADNPLDRAVGFAEMVVADPDGTKYRNEPVDVTELVNTDADGELRATPVDVAAFIEFAGEENNGIAFVVDESLFILVEGPFTQEELIALAQFQVDHLASLAEETQEPVASASHTTAMYI